ncbi:MAG: UvrD-helicase domain-containing protein [Pseudomonadota bacterium]
MSNNTRFFQIKASAGSGKTYTLTQRFLHLLAHAEEGDKESWAIADFNRPPQGHVLPYLWTDILAMTFTNSAATDMKERILSELKGLALAKPHCLDTTSHSLETSSDTLSLDITPPSITRPLRPDQAATWVNRIIRRYGALNIRTIDSLLTMLVRLSALELNLPPDFEPAFNSKAFFEPLMDAVLEDARHESHPLHQTLHDACKSILLYKGVEGQKGFTAGKKVRDELHNLLDWHLQHSQPLPTVQKVEIEKLLRELYDDLRTAAHDLVSIADAEGLLVHGTARKGFDKCAQLQYPDTITFSTYIGKESLQKSLIKKSKEPSAEAEQAFFRLQKRTRDFTAGIVVLRKVMVELPLVDLVREVVQRQTQFQLREGKVPAILLPKLASQAVTGEYGPPVAFCRMSTRLARIFIDEFQDTSRDQWTVIQALGLETLSQGGALTLIGDVKQAIYGWRGGDASLFDQALSDEELNSVSDIREENLSTNWRSAASIVRHNNDVFGLLANKQHATNILKTMLSKETPCDVLDDAVDVLCKAFEKSEQFVAPRHENIDGYVEIHHIESPSTPELHDDVREQVHALFENNLAKRHAWRDIAVLVRGNKQAKEVAQWLMSWGIPVVTSNSLRLADHPIIRQTLAMLNFVDYPRNDIAFWECVTGQELFVSVSGHSRQTFEDWLATQKRLGRKGPLFTMFRTDFPQLWQSCFAPFYSRAGLMSAYDTVREIFYRYDVFERYPQEAGFLRRFLEVVYGAESQGHVSLSTFVDFWRTEASDEKVPMPEGMDAVRVMTMHKSKGLQFPVVVIPYHQSGDSNFSKLVHHKIEEHDVVLPECKELGPAYYAAKATEAREKLHLLYVAWTRAERELYAFVTNSAKKPHVFSNAIMELLQTSRTIQDGENATALGTNCIVCQRGTLSPSGRNLPVSDCEQKATRQQGGEIASEIASEITEVSEATEVLAQSSRGLLDDTWRPMQWLPRLKIFRNALQDVQFNERQRGMLVHSCLEHLRLGGHAGEFEQVNIADHVLTAVQNAMRAFRLPIPEPHKVEQELIQIISWFANIPDAPYWLSYGTPEQGILDTYGNRHRVDLLVDDGRERLVVEYKTGQASPDHVGQVRRYLNLLSAMHHGQTNGTGQAQGIDQLQHRPCRGIIVYLDLQRLEYVDSVAPQSSSTELSIVENHCNEVRHA